MKAKHLIVPTMVLVVMTAWLVSRHYTLDAVAKETAALEKRLAASRSQPSRSAGMEINTTSVFPLRDTMDWRSAATLLAKIEQSANPAEALDFDRFQQQLAAMTDAELLAAIQEIHAMELGVVATARLEEALVEPLIEKNPKLALETFGDRTLSDADGVGWYMSVALGEWAKLDTAAAAAWLDARTAEGMFESKTLDGGSEARLEFEAALAESLLATNPQAATDRITALPEDQRLEVLEQLSFPDLDETAQTSYLTMMRSLVPADEQSDALASLAEELVATGGYAAVDTFLTQADVTPQEREASASLVATASIAEIADERPVTRADLEKMRTWLAGHAADAVDRITGQAIAEATQNDRKLDFATAEKLVRDFRQSSGNDQVVEGFLESSAANDNLEQALPLANLIEDRTRRDKLISRLKSGSAP